jgi:hypothetical protein
MAGAKDRTFSGLYLALLFNNTPIPGLANPSSPPTDLYLSLHIDDPTATGDQSTNEVGYAGYARVPIPRTSAGFEITGNSVKLVRPATFPAVPSSQTYPATYFAIGQDPTGPGQKMYSGPIFPYLTLAFGIPVRLTVGTTITEN